MTPRRRDSTTAASASDASRRRLVSAFAATSVAAWTAPAVLSLDSVAAAVGSAAGPTLSGSATPGTLAAGQSLRPNSVTWSSNTQFYVFEERSVTLASGQATDSGMTLPVGQEICSHLIHYSPSSGTVTLNGGVNFSGTIVGYDWQNGTLTAGDAQWGVPGVNYGTTVRGMEWPGNDTIAFTLPGNISMSLFAGSTFVDQLRVYVVY